MPLAAREIRFPPGAQTSNRRFSSYYFCKCPNKNPLIPLTDLKFTYMYDVMNNYKSVSNTYEESIVYNF